MTKNKQKNKFWNRIFGILLTLIGVFCCYFFTQGLVELIKNQTAGIIVFYGLAAVLIIWRLVDFLEFSLDMVFNKEGELKW